MRAQLSSSHAEKNSDVIVTAREKKVRVCLEFAVENFFLGLEFITTQVWTSLCFCSLPNLPSFSSCLLTERILRAICLYVYHQH